MENQNVEVIESVEDYEAPVLVDLDDVPACRSQCSTGGSAVE